MPTDQIKQRLFATKLLNQITNQLTERFDQVIKSLGNRLDNLIDRTHSVRVVNFPKPNDYQDKIERIIKSLEKMPPLLQRAADKELAVEKTEVDLSGVIDNLKQLQKIIAQQQLPDNKQNTQQLIQAIQGVQAQVAAIKIPRVDIPSPQKIEIPRSMSMQEAGAIIQELRDMRLALASLSGQPKIDIPNFDYEQFNQGFAQIVEAIQAIPQPNFEVPKTISIDNFPPQKIAQPVTNININPLRGLVHPSASTVRTTLTPLPEYGVLNNRRSLIFFNNSSNTVYIGGSNVTTGNGTPIAAQSYSPAFDSGPLQKWYGVVESGTADVRCLEIANDSGL